MLLINIILWLSLFHFKNFWAFLSFKNLLFNLYIFFYFLPLCIYLFIEEKNSCCIDWHILMTFPYLINDLLVSRCFGGWVSSIFLCFREQQNWVLEFSSYMPDWFIKPSGYLSPHQLVISQQKSTNKLQNFKIQIRFNFFFFFYLSLMASR